MILFQYRPSDNEHSLESHYIITQTTKWQRLTSEEQSPGEVSEKERKLKWKKKRNLFSDVNFFSFLPCREKLQTEAGSFLCSNYT